MIRILIEFKAQNQGSFREQMHRPALTQCSPPVLFNASIDRRRVERLYVQPICTIPGTNRRPNGKLTAPL